MTITATYRPTFVPGNGLAERSFSVRRLGEDRAADKTKDLFHRKRAAQKTVRAEMAFNRRGLTQVEREIQVLLHITRPMVTAPSSFTGIAGPTSVVMRFFQKWNGCLGRCSPYDLSGWGTWQSAPHCRSGAKFVSALRPLRRTGVVYRVIQPLSVSFCCDACFRAAVAVDTDFVLARMPGMEFDLSTTRKGDGASALSAVTRRVRYAMIGSGRHVRRG